MKLDEMKKLLDTRSKAMLTKLHNECSVFSGTRMTPLTWNETRFISLAAKNWNKIIAVIEAAKLVDFLRDSACEEEEYNDAWIDLTERLESLEKK